MTLDHALYLRFAGALLALLTPIVIYLLSGRSNRLAGVVSAILVSVAIMYLFIAGPLFVLNFELDQAVTAMDYDRDGIWTPEEKKQWSAEDHRVMQMWVGDGGRNVFGYLLSPIFCLVYSSVLFSVAYAISWILGKLRSHS